MKKLIIASVVATGIFASLQASAQYSLTGTSYSQDFDTLGSAGTSLAVLTGDGWSAGTNTPLQTGSGDGNGRTNGAIQAVAALTVDNGGNNAGKNANYGTTGASDRALGSLGSGTITRLTEFRFVNNTGLTISDLAISYTGEQWRLGKTGTDSSFGQGDYLLLAYSFDGTTFTAAGAPGSAFNFISPTTAGTIGALDGNASANRMTLRGGTLSGINIADTATFYLRWVDPDSGGADNALAIDDLSLTATLVPEPSTVALVGFSLLSLLAVRRRRS